MAAVYEAEHVEIGKHVAIKVLNRDLTELEVLVERFMREAKAAAAIRSVNICDVYDVGRLGDGTPFIVLELLVGENLLTVWSETGAWNLVRSLILRPSGTRSRQGSRCGRSASRPEKPIASSGCDPGDRGSEALDSASRSSSVFQRGAAEPTHAQWYGLWNAVVHEPGASHRLREHRPPRDLRALGCIVFECLTGKTARDTTQGMARCW